MRGEVIIHLDHMRFVKGIQGINRGTRVTIDLCPDKILINNQEIIPLNNVKQAETFQVRSIRLDNSVGSEQAGSGWIFLKRVRTIIRLILGLDSQKLIILTLKFVDRKGEECSCMFVSDNRPCTCSFADAVNKQSGIQSGAEIPGKAGGSIVW